jgi:hypothetical protein
MLINTFEFEAYNFQDIIQVEFFVQSQTSHQLINVPIQF